MKHRERSALTLWKPIAGLLLALATLGPGFAGVGWAGPVRVGHVEAELISESRAIAPGQAVRVGVRFQMDEDWHINWRNAGDAGLPPTIDWDLPTGLTADPVTWPYPERIVVDPLVSYGYHGEVVLPVLLHARESLTIGSTVQLKAQVDWLVCSDVCVPGATPLTLDLPVVGTTPEPDSIWSQAFAEARSRNPLDNSGWEVTADPDAAAFDLVLTPPEWWTDTLASVYFAPHASGTIDDAAPQVLSHDGSTYRLRIARDRNSPTLPDSLSGVLVSSTGWRGPGSERAIQFSTSLRPADAAPAIPVAVGMAASIWQPLLFALLGGLILNLMPCVLPVLSLKVLGLVQQAGESPRVARRHGILFALGVVASFWVLAGLLLGLRSAGEQLGWGFQLQSPLFVTVLAGFFFLLGLSLAGVFEIGASLVGIGGRRRGGAGGAFASGITAAVVATPCTAPFMGSALGYALTQPAWVSLAIFTSLGLGMALPYVALTAVPAWLRFVPKPGRWMETLKQAMAFMLFATVLWLAWLLGNQAGAQAVIALLGMFLVLALAAWIWGRWGTVASNRAVRSVALSLASLLLAAGFGGGVGAVRMVEASPSVPSATRADDRWEPFDGARVEQLQRDGRIVFIDFTADWCLSCKVNERVALASESVRTRFDELDAVLMKADWTRRSPAITRALADYGRNSVPLYVLYPGDPDADPVILPEILTPGLVLQALEPIEP
jgi:thiol:disulfide interchange protein DsbD